MRETLYDARLGYWEAKDLGDNLDKEISLKIAKGYPLNNTIFENTSQAVLFQGGKERRRFDLTDKAQLADPTTTTAAIAARTSPIGRWSSFGRITAQAHQSSEPPG